MKKSIIFGFGGLLIGGAGGFIAGRITYKKKLDKAERDIEVLLKEINRPEEESEVSDEDGTEEEESSEGAAQDEESKEQPSSNGYGSVDAGDSVDYDTFYTGKGYKHIKAVAGCTDLAEYESPQEFDPEDPDDPNYDFDKDNSFWETDEEREYRIRQELIESGIISDPDASLDNDEDAVDREINSGKKPKLISEDSYWDEYPEFEKRSLEYYTDSDTLVDTESEEEIFDETMTVGDALDKYGYRDNDMESIIYVRNFAFGTDYQISKVFGGWDPM